MNVAIFEELHYAPLVIADVTGERPNCFMELGYALGRGTRVLATAAEGTLLPFDQDKIPVHFWRAEGDSGEEQTRFLDFWQKYVDRPPIVD
jgi:nucleoside 2-deoxyribosyltransferase